MESHPVLLDNIVIAITTTVAQYRRALVDTAVANLRRNSLSYIDKLIDKSINYTEDSGLVVWTQDPVPRRNAIDFVNTLRSCLMKRTLFPTFRTKFHSFIRLFLETIDSTSERYKTINELCQAVKKVVEPLTRRDDPDINFAASSVIDASFGIRDIIKKYLSVRKSITEVDAIQLCGFIKGLEVSISIIVTAVSSRSIPLPPRIGSPGSHIGAEVPAAAVLAPDGDLLLDGIVDGIANAVTTIVAQHCHVAGMRDCAFYVDILIAESINDTQNSRLITWIPDKATRTKAIYFVKRLRECLEERALYPSGNSFRTEFERLIRLLLVAIDPTIQESPLCEAVKKVVEPLKRRDDPDIAFAASSVISASFGIRNITNKYSHVRKTITDADAIQLCGFVKALEESMGTIVTTLSSLSTPLPPPIDSPRLHSAAELSQHQLPSPTPFSSTPVTTFSPPPPSARGSKTTSSRPSLSTRPCNTSFNIL